MKNNTLISIKDREPISERLLKDLNEFLEPKFDDLCENDRKLIEAAYYNDLEQFALLSEKVIEIKAVFHAIRMNWPLNREKFIKILMMNHPFDFSNYEGNAIGKCIHPKKWHELSKVDKALISQMVLNVKENSSSSFELFESLKDVEDVKAIINVVVYYGHQIIYWLLKFHPDIEYLQHTLKRIQESQSTKCIYNLLDLGVDKLEKNEADAEEYILNLIGDLKKWLPEKQLNEIKGSYYFFLCNIMYTKITQDYEWIKKIANEDIGGNFQRVIKHTNMQMIEDILNVFLPFKPNILEETERYILNCQFLTFDYHDTTAIEGTQLRIPSKRHIQDVKKEIFVIHFIRQLQKIYEEDKFLSFKEKYLRAYKSALTLNYGEEAMVLAEQLFKEKNFDRAKSCAYIVMMENPSNFRASFIITIACLHEYRTYRFGEYVEHTIELDGIRYFEELMALVKESDEYIIVDKRYSILINYLKPLFSFLENSNKVSHDLHEPSTFEKMFFNELYNANKLNQVFVEYNKREIFIELSICFAKFGEMKFLLGLLERIEDKNKNYFWELKNYFISVLKSENANKVKNVLDIFKLCNYDIIGKIINHEIEYSDRKLGKPIKPHAKYFLMEYQHGTIWERDDIWLKLVLIGLEQDINSPPPSLEKINFVLKQANMTAEGMATYYEYGEVYFFHKEYKSAVFCALHDTYYRSNVESKIQSYLLITKSLAKLNFTDEAKEYANRAIKLDPDKFETFQTMADYFTAPTFIESERSRIYTSAFARTDSSRFYYTYKFEDSIPFRMKKCLISALKLVGIEFDNTLGTEFSYPINDEYLGDLKLETTLTVLANYGFGYICNNILGRLAEINGDKVFDSFKQIATINRQNGFVKPLRDHHIFNNEYFNNALELDDEITEKQSFTNKKYMWRNTESSNITEKIISYALKNGLIKKMKFDEENWKKDDIAPLSLDLYTNRIYLSIIKGTDSLQNKNFIESLSFSNCVFSSPFQEDIKRIMEICDIKKISFVHCNSFNNFLGIMEPLKSKVCLTSLSFAFSFYEENIEQFLGSDFNKSSKIMTPLDVRNIKNIGDDLSKLTQLKTLYLSGFNSRLQQSDICTFLYKLRSLVNLQTLSIMGKYDKDSQVQLEGISPQAIDAVCDILPLMPKLRFLSLQLDSKADYSFSKLFTCISYNNSLIYLGLGKIKINIAELTNYSEIFQKNKILKCMDVKVCEKSDFFDEELFGREFREKLQKIITKSKVCIINQASGAINKEYKSVMEQLVQVFDKGYEIFCSNVEHKFNQCAKVFNISQIAEFSESIYNILWESKTYYSSRENDKYFLKPFKQSDIRLLENYESKIVEYSSWMNDAMKANGMSL